MATLTESLAAILVGAVAPLFGDGMLHRAQAQGGFADVPIRCRTEALRQETGESGLPEHRLSLIVLLPGLGTGPTTEDEVTAAGRRWRIAAVEQDPAGSHATLDARPL